MRKRPKSMHIVYLISDLKLMYPLLLQVRSTCFPLCLICYHSPPRWIHHLLACLRNASRMVLIRHIHAYLVRRLCSLQVTHSLTRAGAKVCVHVWVRTTHSSVNHQLQAKECRAHAHEGTLRVSSLHRIS